MSTFDNKKYFHWMSTHVLNCFKKMLTFKLLFPSRRVISEFSFLDFRSLPFDPSAELVTVSRAPIFGEFCVLVACWQNNPSISFQSSSAIGLFWCELATKVQIFVLPINLFDGILFQLMVFILVFGTGVSCCGNNLPRSTISGVFGRCVSVWVNKLKVMKKKKKT